MKFQIICNISLMVLTIVDLCMSVQNLADQTANSNSILNSNNNSKLSSKEHLWNNQNDDDIKSDNSEMKHFHTKIDRSTIAYGNLYQRNHSNARADDDSDHKNFLMLNYLSDGEIERRIHFNGITAKETLVSNNGESLVLWQLSYRDTFIQMIHTYDGEILDCDFLKGMRFGEEFVQQFYDEIQRMKNFNKIAGIDKSNVIPKFRHHSRHHIPQIDMTMDSDNELIGATNLTYHPLRSIGDVPKDLIQYMQFDSIKSQCEAYHQKVMGMAKDLDSDNDEIVQSASEHLHRKKRALSDWLIVPHTKWCGRGQTADNYSQLGGASKADKCCRRHDHCKFNIYAMTTKWRLFNYRPFTISHCSCDMRRRRDLTNMLRLPGTKWCGKGYSAKKYVELGGRSKADRCCRQHDKSCPFWIMGFETKYGLFNWRINTLMHCKCDDRFRTCLKMADSADATMVGKLFFNIVQTKCFVLKPEKYCKEHSWWGSCVNEGVRKRAHLRTNKKF